MKDWHAMSFWTHHSFSWDSFGSGFEVHLKGWRLFWNACCGPGGILTNLFYSLRSHSWFCLAEPDLLSQYHCRLSIYAVASVEPTLSQSFSPWPRLWALWAIWGSPLLRALAWFSSQLWPVTSVFGSGYSILEFCFFDQYSSSFRYWRA